MKTFILICLSALVMVSSADKLDDLLNTDMEKLLADDAVRKQVVGCMTDELPCGDYQAYKDMLPDLIATNCGKCTPEQKKRYEEINKFVLEKYPNEYNAVVSKYRPKTE
ncbi:putative odorant-binding protein A10 [Ostrinia furnacalis]|uniref:Chemosensory protein 3 n=1 Tax=Ostrinia furnacalis TaxID=93504 RepID=A0A1B4ZBK8_OSTFU|nr:putative odorant-binding protein A10 [Ostrinia furnacalis]XP_028174947.1 putative odorant-binding protein A10 [Ostrinia furnacalis]BAV56807.1 chemosensory protein 3 [Ostrinia furnacalis]